MSVERSEVDRIAALAHLSLSEAEADRLTKELSGILDHVVALGGKERAPAPASTTPDDGPAPHRPERTLTPLSRPPEAFAPDFRDGLFVVPRLPGLGEVSADGSDAP